MGEELNIEVIRHLPEPQRNTAKLNFFDTKISSNIWQCNTQHRTIHLNQMNYSNFDLQYGP
jgi:hypothetical protein